MEKITFTHRGECILILDGWATVDFEEANQDKKFAKEEEEQ